MKLGKSAAFIICMIIISTMFLALVFIQFVGKANGFPIGAFLTVVVGMGTAFIGLEVTNNGVRGKYFNQEVAKIDAINKEGEEKCR